MKTKLVIFGITGDLSTRKLLPALTHIVKRGDCDPLDIYGVSRRDVDAAELVQRATGEDTLLDRLHIVSMDVADSAAYQTLKSTLDQQDDEQIVVYLSVPPGAAADIVDFLGEAGINNDRVKIMFEKPFGYDTQSAKDFVERTSRYYKEEQIYRIDHYMAKDVALGLLDLRRKADSHHHTWNKDVVRAVHILAAETLGVEDRAHFYEQTGALRDVVQGHLMQLLSIVLLDATATPPFDLENLPERRLQALQGIHPADPLQSLRGQYKGYEQAVENIGSRVESYVRVHLKSSDSRWEGVPLTLETGKKLHEKRTSITVEYKDGSKDVFVEGDTVSTERVPDAYERVLAEAIKGKKYIFTTSPEIIRSWEILAPIQEAWNMETVPLLPYDQGTDPRQAFYEKRYI